MDNLSTNEAQAMAHLSPVWTHLSHIVVDHASGSCLFDSEGVRYLDFTSGIGVTNTGHCHPSVVDAVQQQAARLLHGQANIVFSPSVLALVKELRTVVPDHLDGFFFSNSGAEAVEGAIKLARHATGRPNIIVFQGSFHGRTNQTMAMTTSKTIYRVGYQPLASGIFAAPFPYSYRYGWDEQRTVEFCLNELEFLLHSQTDSAETAAIIIEPVLGEGGYVPLPAGFLQGLRDICDRHDLLLILDEVQSGFGRTARFFALEHYGIMPDVMVMAKGLASGLPMSGVAAPLDLMRRWKPGTHGGTYGGNPVAAAAATATIRVIRDEGLLENAATRGQQLMQGLAQLQERYPLIGDVRGLGLMVGLEFSASTRQRSKQLASAVQRHCLERRLLILTCGTFGNVVRWIPPLVVTESEIDEALTIFDQALAAAQAEEEG
ncbi:MAG: aminotransferase class III-fold pyridoxal phosphate-dependent enzyme [Candidatus Promineifilaceae bacterium]|nr:aminotransferase class III-fold pyridoxal phosphate-dependent enzyme [Candidatus Promineifilaceae bacterium]